MKKDIEFVKRHSAKIDRLSKQLRANANREVMRQAAEWTRIGAHVNYSFFDVARKTKFELVDYKKALADLGINFDMMPGRKWYQFWISNDRRRLEQAIEKIPT